MPLTSDQQKAANAFFDFLPTSAREFVLSGSAGVGKTFVMGHICDKVMPLYEDACKLLGIHQQFKRVEFTATTNKAAEVLERAIKRPVQTIHSYLGLRVKEDYKTGKTRLEPTLSTKPKKNTILFIEEASMIDEPLYNFIQELMVDSKIVYVGDHAQMAPVGEELSHVFKNVNPNHFVFLRQPVRNAGNPALVNLCSQLRQTVETGIFQPIQEVPGSIEYLDDDGMQRELARYLAVQTEDTRILAFTNARVQLFNGYIREMRGLPLDFQVGDELVVAQTYQDGKTSLSVERRVEVLEIPEEIHETNSQGVNIPYRKVRIKPPFGGELEVPICLDTGRRDFAIQKLKQKKEWGEYFFLKGFFADLRFKDACTVYKSQGSTYETVFIDIGNIGTCQDPQQVARMLFVGASRATTRVFLYGTLPPQYSGGNQSWQIQRAG